MKQSKLSEVLRKHHLWLREKESGERANLRGADLREANLREANLRGADIWGANLWGADLREADLWRADLDFCKGILSFTGEKHLLIYFKHNNAYYFKIGCITKTCNEWLKEFETVGEEHEYGENTKLYGDVIKLFSQYELWEANK